MLDQRQARRTPDNPKLGRTLPDGNGRAANAVITPGCRATRAWRGNLLEDALGPLPVDRGRVSLPLRPFEIATLLVECAR